MFGGCVSQVVGRREKGSEGEGTALISDTFKKKKGAYTRIHIFFLKK
jgi:hypothetical protein